MDDFIIALLKEIELTAFVSEADKHIETIYFGGGTPSLLSMANLQQVLNVLHKKFIVANDAEVTLEANPDDIHLPVLQHWLTAGINRLSVGIQSFSEAELTWMNRAHNAEASRQCITDIKIAGFPDFSIDLIYGSPLQTDAGLLYNMQRVFDAEVPHISCYALTVEPNTALHYRITKNTSPPVDADQQADQFNIILEGMRQNGYEQYEISNFAKPGHRSRHNSNYWKGKAYYGFGPSAHSFDGHLKRSWNVANNAAYIRSLQQNIIPAESELLTFSQRLNEYIMISLRTAEGIDLEKLSATFGETALAALKQRSIKFMAQDLLADEDHFLKLTFKGKFLADGIAGDLFTDPL